LAFLLIDYTFCEKQKEERSMSSLHGPNGLGLHTCYNGKDNKLQECEF